MPLNRQVIFPRDAYPTPNYCKFFLLGSQAAGDIDNSIPGKAKAIKRVELTDGECWLTPGYATVGGGATEYATLDAGTAALDSLATSSLIFAVRVKKIAAAYQAAEGYLYSSYKPGSEYGGIVFSHLTSGAARLYINATDGTTVSLTTGANVITNGTTANERTLVFIVPREGGNGYIGIDGLESITSSVAAVAGKPLAGGWDGRIGVSRSGIAADLHGLASLQAYSVPLAGASINRLAVYDWVQRNPHLPIPDWVFAL